MDLTIRGKSVLGLGRENLSSFTRLFKRRIALSIGKIIIPGISIREMNCFTHWKEIYPVDSVIYLSNKRALVSEFLFYD